MLKKIKTDTVFCGVFILFSIFIIIESTKLKYWSKQYAPGPGFVPLWVGAFLLVLSIIAFFQSLRGNGITLDRILKSLGFSITSNIVLSAVLSRGTKLFQAIIISIFVTAACFLVFKVALQVQIPVNVFGW